MREIGLFLLIFFMSDLRQLPEFEKATKKEFFFPRGTIIWGIAILLVGFAAGFLMGKKQGEIKILSTAGETS